jgi:hypothetical protein
MTAGYKNGTIIRMLRNKVEEWLDDAQLTPSEINDIRPNVIVTGGAIASMLMGENPSDYDIYFRDKKTALQIARHYCKVYTSNTGPNPRVLERKVLNIRGEMEDRIVFWIQSAGIAMEDQKDYQYFEYQDPDLVTEFLEQLDSKQKIKRVHGIKFFSDNALTLHGKVQLVIRFYGEPAEIHRNFDFVHATCSFDCGTGNLSLPPDAMRSILSKTLMYSGSLYPIATLFRLRKFYERGWRISAGQLLKIAMQISRIDLNDPNVLREQILGVDVAYMREILAYLKDHPERIDTTYVMQLIDKIFEGELEYD